MTQAFIEVMGSIGNETDSLTQAFSAPNAACGKS
jgi:hypothetical protein